jgi:DNA-binding SARP family transcriptional activator/tetratricopeptide (TPR) repeat protein
MSRLRGGAFVACAGVLALTSSLIRPPFPAPVEPYRLHLFGELTLLDPAGAPVSLWRPMVALLALLVATPGGVVRREQAAALLWPESDEAAARRALRQLLFRLRRAGIPVDADRIHIRLRREVVDVDVLAFEAAVADGRAEEAVALYGGPFLDGFTLPGSVEFDQWADATRERLRRVAVEALGGLVDQAVSRGRWADAFAAAERWRTLEPLDEEPVGRIIALHLQRGDGVAAKSAFDAFGAHLAAELGERPSAVLEAVVARPPAIVPVAPAGEDGRGRRRELPLVGREEEFARLTACWERTTRGGQELVLVRGEAGIGKSRLAEEFRRWVAASGGTTLGCPAYAIEASVPYATLAGGLRHALHAPGLAGVDARTVVELSRIVPAFATRFPGAAVPPETDLEAGHLRLMEAWRDLLDSLVHEAPVLIVVDDLPWADEASLAALHYGWRTLPDRAVMIVATARGTDAEGLGAGAALVATALRGDPAAFETLVLGPLGRVAIAQAAAASRPHLAPDDPVTESLERRTGGNPLFLAELLRAAADGDPVDAGPTETIRLVTLDRVRRLEPDAVALLHAAAVLGRQFPLPLAAAVSELTPAAAARAVATLLDDALVRQVGYGYDFVHDVVRDVVLDAMGMTRRAALHRRAFAELEPRPDEREAGLAAERVGALAHHAAAAGMDAEAHRWHLEAGRSAVALYAPAEAARALARALDFARTDADRRAAWEAIGELARVRSDFRGAAVAYQNALETTADPGLRLRLRLRLLHMGLRGGLLDRPTVQELAEALRTEAEQRGQDALGHLLLILGEAAARAGDFRAAAGHAQDAARCFRSAAEPRGLVRALLLHAGATSRAGTADALASLEEAEAVAIRYHLHPERSDVRIEKASELSRRGQWDDALDALARVRSELADAGEWGNAAITWLNEADLRVRRGEWDAAVAALAEAESISWRFDFPHVGVVARLNRALLDWLRDDPVAAVTGAREARTAAEEAGLAAPTHVAAAIEALAHLDAGDAAAAAAALEGVGEEDQATPHPSWSDDTELVVAARARLMAGAGHPAPARDLLVAARRRTPDPYAAAFLALELAELERPVDPAAARALAREALVRLEALGASPLARRAARLAGTTAPPEG